MHKQEELSIPALRRFFDKWLYCTFVDLGLHSDGVREYLTDLLTRFARTENLYRLKAWGGKEVLTVVEMLLEAEARAHPESSQFNPNDEREIRRHVGDYTMFMTGIFREYVSAIRVLDLYIKQGELAYLGVSELDEIAERHTAPLFRRLFREFERLSGALDYMKKVYFRPDIQPGEFRNLIDRLSRW